MTNDLLKDYITEHEAADAFGVSRRTLERWHRLGEGPRRTYIGRRIFYHRKALAEWLASRERERVAGAA